MNGLATAIVIVGGIAGILFLFLFEGWDLDNTNLTLICGAQRFHFYSWERLEDVLGIDPKPLKRASAVILAKDGKLSPLSEKELHTQLTPSELAQVEQCSSERDRSRRHLRYLVVRDSHPLFERATALGVQRFSLEGAFPDQKRFFA